jgi:hypothetical protein
MFELKRSVVFVLILSLIIPALIFGQGYVQPVSGVGNVNWTQQMVRCTGIGAPNPNSPQGAQRAGALRAAKLDALRNLLEVVKGINLTSETTVENAMLTSDVINSRVEGVVRGYQIVDTRYMSTGDVEVDVEVPLTGVLLDALLPQQFGGGVLQTGGQLLCPTCGQPWPAGKPVPPNVQLIQSGVAGTTAMTGGGVYTGLVVDARELGVRPAMAPRILNEDGEEIYGSKYVSRDFAIDIGMVAYDKDINQARMNERVADNPLVVKAIKATGPNKTDVVVSDADGTMIHNAASNMNFLQHCKVMFILD